MKVRTTNQEITIEGTKVIIGGVVVDDYDRIAIEGQYIECFINEVLEDRFMVY